MDATTVTSLISNGMYGDSTPGVPKHRKKCPCNQMVGWYMTTLGVMHIHNLRAVARFRPHTLDPIGGALLQDSLNP
jgi:hypothetical protein